MPAMLVNNALVHNLSPKSTAGFKEELYNHPCKVGPAMLVKKALVHNLSQKSKTEFKEELYNDPDTVVPAMLDKTAFKKLKWYSILANADVSRG